MFCVNCGKQLPDIAKFCAFCGTNLSAPVAHTPVAESKELDREALKIYLTDVAVLECALADLKCKLERQKSDITSFKERILFRKVELTKKYSIEFRYDGEEFYVRCYSHQGYRPGTYIALEKSEHSCFAAYKQFSHDSYGLLRVMGDTFSQAISSSLEISTEHYYFVPGAGKIKKLAEEAFEQFQKEAPAEYNEKLQALQPKLTVLAGIEQDIVTATVLLNKAYSANIIPNQFRNIQSMWLIRDYIATSNEPLTEALLHCNSNSEREKANKAINQGINHFLGQALGRAANKQAAAQNRQFLSNLASVETNAAKAAQYSQIVSSDAELNAWLGGANYVKN